MGERRLSNKRRAFVEEYLKCWNASEAARRAGYKGQANVIGPRLLANVSIQALIKARLDELKMGADEVLVRLAQQARAEYSAYIRANGTVNLERMLADGKGHLIKAIKWSQTGLMMVEFYDAQTAINAIGRHQRLFDSQLNLNLDLANLSDEQLRRIADGEDPIKVIASAAPGASGAGAETPAGDG